MDHAGWRASARMDGPSSKRSGRPGKFLTDDEAAQVAQAVDRAERHTTAEIKVAIVRHCWGDLRDKAEHVFRKLGLHKTEQRNCVLILLVLANREFVIFGDRGIHESVGDGFWTDVRDAMRARFMEDRFGQGLCEGVGLIGGRLAEHFPPHAGDRDEISDEVVHEE